jgi:transcriptional regulator with XRE-family HTH domain
MKFIMKTPQAFRFVSFAAKPNWLNITSKRKKAMQGSYLKKLRLDAGMTQKDMASKLGYLVNGQPNRSHIARIEGGHQKVTPRLVLAVKYICEKVKAGIEIEYQEPEKTWQEELAEDKTNDTPTLNLSSDSHIL